MNNQLYELERKIDFAVKLLRSIPTDEGPVEVNYSGGKDSDVILELAKMASIPYRAIYKNTTVDPPVQSSTARIKAWRFLPRKPRFLSW